MTLLKDAQPSVVHLVLDKYIKDSTKCDARKSRSETNSIRLYVTGFGQLMPVTDKEWVAALSNTTTKKTYYKLFASYVNSGQASSMYPTTVNDEVISWKIDLKSGMLSEEFVYNHEEADTRMIYHASLQE